MEIWSDGRCLFALKKVSQVSHKDHKLRKLIDLAAEGLWPPGITYAESVMARRGNIAPSYKQLLKDGDDDT